MNPPPQLMTPAALRFSVANPPEGESRSLYTRLKEAMIAEGTLITANLKVFLTVLSVGVIAAVDMGTPSGSGEHYSLLALLVGAVGFLVRLLLAREKRHDAELKKRDDKIEALWRHIVKANGGDDPDEDRPTTHRARPR